MANPIKAVKSISRAVGGITGKGSKNVSPTYKAFPTVKIKFKNVPGVLEERLINYTGPSMIRHMKETTPATKKEAKANKRGLKAANKPVSKENAYQYGHIGSLSRNRIKNMQPARPNRIRGGSMKSKLNFPKGMK
jgi:hypothetical protein